MIPDNLEPSQLAPHNREAEEAVLGAVLINSEVFYEVSSFLGADDFFILRHSWIWEAIERLVERNEVIDYITVVEELRAQNRLEDVGGAAYITYLMSSAVTSSHAEPYGRIVERSATRRRLLAVADHIAELARREDEPIAEIIDRAEESLFAVTERQLRRDTTDIREVISGYYDNVEFMVTHRQDVVGVPSGFRDLDTIIGGFQKSDLTILAGRPGMGKTAFKLNVAINAARTNARVAIFSLEMSNEQLVQRMIAMESGVNVQNLRLGHLETWQWDAFVTVSDSIGKLRIYLDDTPALSVTQLRTKCRRIFREHGLDLIIVDYLQLMSASDSLKRSENRVQEISNISRGLKELARELKIPVLSGAQLSRAVEQRADKRPMLSDLRESGCLSGSTQISLADGGGSLPLADLEGVRDFAVWALDEASGVLLRAEVSHVFCTGEKPTYRLITAGGKTLCATANHPFYTRWGWRRLDALALGEEIQVGERVALRDGAGLVGSVALEPTFEAAWDRVSAIIPTGVERVFDMTVPQYHSFLANEILVHNSIEQDADVVMFIYRDDLYNDMSDRQNLADIIVAKHRNGPTGTAVLYFDKQITRFGNPVHNKINLENLNDDFDDVGKVNFVDSEDEDEEEGQGDEGF